MTDTDTDTRGNSADAINDSVEDVQIFISGKYCLW